MSDDKANKLMAEGKETETKFAWFAGDEEKRANARKLYLQAAALYKGSANFVAAATAYQRACDMSAANKSDIDVADDASNVMAMNMKCDNFDASRAACAKVVDLYVRSNKTSQAAKACQQFGEWKPSTGKFTDEQRREQDTFLEKAITFYRQEGSRSTANELRLKTVERKALAGEYTAAAKDYEAIAKEVLDDSLLRTTAQRHFFMVLLCFVADMHPGRITEDTERLRAKFEWIQERDSQFHQYTQEFMLIQGLISAFEDLDVEKYDDAQARYEEICAVDTLKARLLLLGKQALRAAVEGSSR